MINVNDALLQLFQGYKIEAALQGDWITFAQSPMRTSAALVQEIERAGGITAQLDVCFEISTGAAVIESFAGLGTTRDEAATDAFRNFVAGSFHVLLAAFLKHGSDDDQVSHEEWNIGGTTRRVTVGNAALKGKLPDPSLDWFTYFHEKLLAQPLGPEVHWVRLYYGQAQNKPLACEVLLDNQVWDEMQAEMAAYAWPSSGDFYSVRLFLVIAEAIPDPLTPEGAVSLLAQIAAAHPALNDDGIYQALHNAGVPDALAGRVINFTQIAWGRVLLARMGITFSPDYFCFDAEGNVMETGPLARDLSFAAASRLCVRYLQTPAFQRLSAASADVQAVSNALNNGSTQETLRSSVMSPPFVFASPPTGAGWEKAQQVIAQKTGPQGKGEPQENAAQPPAQTKKPWWKLGNR